MKKLLSILLVLALALTAFAACATAPQTDALAPATGDEPATDAPADEPAAEEGEPYELHIQFVGLFEQNTDREAVQEAINAIVTPAINVKLVIDPIFIGDLPTNTSLAVAGDEKIDIVVVGLTQAIDGAVSDGLLLPIDDLLQTHAPDAYKVIEPTIEAGMIGGKTYGVSGIPCSCMAAALVYNKTMADQYGITMHDKMTYEEMTAVAATLKEHGVYFTSQSNSSVLNMKFFKAMEVFGDNGTAGVIIDPVNSTQVVNIFESPEFEEYARTMKLWGDAGYMPADALTDSTAIQEYLGQQKLFMTPTGLDFDSAAVWQYKDFETGFALLDDRITSTSGVNEFMLAIAANCKNPEKAMQFINLLYSNAEVLNLLQYGIEGQDYVFVEGSDKIITRMGTPNADGNAYFSTFSRFGDPMLKYAVDPQPESYYDDLQANYASAKKTKSFGYAFDASDYTAELGALSNVLAEYMPLINAGLAPDLDAHLADFRAALKAAGIEAVIAANQAQLDAYLAN